MMNGFSPDKIKITLVCCYIYRHRVSLLMDYVCKVRSFFPPGKSSGCGRQKRQGQNSDTPEAEVLEAYLTTKVRSPPTYTHARVVLIYNMILLTCLPSEILSTHPLMHYK